MKITTTKSWLISSAAIIALGVAAHAEPTANLPSMTIQDAAKLAAEAVENQRLLRKLTLPTDGMVAVHVPGNSGLTIKIDGQVVVDATGTRRAELREDITGILSLQSGDHAVEIGGADIENTYLSGIMVNQVGQTPQMILDATTAIEVDEANEILAARSSLDPAGAPAAVKSAGETQQASAFSIGGGSSRSEGAATPGAAPMTASVQSAATASDIATRAATEGSGGGKRKVALSSSVGRLGSIGMVPEIPTAFGGNGGGSSDSDAPPPPPPAGAVVMSPLSPPTNVTLTQMVELTAVGNSNNQVPNTGATLFGGVMDNAMFDQVDVVVGPVNRRTTVDVGAQTGQFAIRLFEEDFAQGANVTVTLTGSHSSGSDVTSEPVSYTVTGVVPTDGATQALSRLTFGPTPALYARLRGIGFEAYVEQQLNPDRINDRAFQNMRPGNLVNRRTDNRGEMFRGLMAHEIAHAAFSEKQLQEVMAQFWSNHFHAVNKDTNIYQQAILDRDFFRANALGNFQDLLLYSARSPLMSQYLDNDQNRRGRINENYGREILELSTIGTEAGYTPEDVIAVSRIFTGWAYERTNPNAEGVAPEYRFAFFPDRHDTDDKVIPFFDTTIEGREGPAGVQEGEELIAILAQHPLTRNRICGKIVQLLVADVPPASFVQSCAAAWEETGGEIEPMLRAILLDPAYIRNVEYQRSKGKTPFEYAVSAIRAFGATPTGNADDRERFYRIIRETSEDAGYAPLSFPVPTGLPEVASAWSNTASMIAAYREMTNIARQPERYGVNLAIDMQDAGLETAEEVASYLLAVATADRFSEEEFEATLTALKQNDGIFDPRNNNEQRGYRRAIGVIAVTPSFLLQ
ncbi:DUF1800 domain-containing protein [Yoonia sp. 2307UL14-13]|uniref:DUF1800 domain-containing protein n=1 Tax=Yoonia sp. 2307UL14-13 TaxID=3126506 RepID=UPI0030AC36FC